MNIQLPNGVKVQLDSTLNYDDRVKVVQGILIEWKSYFLESWELNKTKVCLDVLSSYLCLAKSEEEKNKEDKFVMSLNKMKKMIRGDAKVKMIADLPIEHQHLIGLVDYDDGSK